MPLQHCTCCLIWYQYPSSCCSGYVPVPCCPDVCASARCCWYSDTVDVAGAVSCAPPSSSATAWRCWAWLGWLAGLASICLAQNLESFFLLLWLNTTTTLLLAAVFLRALLQSLPRGSFAFSTPLFSRPSFASFNLVPCRASLVFRPSSRFSSTRPLSTLCLRQAVLSGNTPRRCPKPTSSFLHCLASHHRHHRQPRIVTSRANPWLLAHYGFQHAESRRGRAHSGFAALSADAPSVRYAHHRSPRQSLPRCSPYRSTVFTWPRLP